MTTQRPAAVLLVLLAAVAAVLGIRWNQQFKRLAQVDVGATPVQLGTLNRMTLTNPSSSRVEFELRCYIGLHGRGAAAPVERLVLMPQERREFQVYPEHASGDLPRMLPNKNCAAVWQGPFGWEHLAWRAIWQYSKPPYKEAL